MPVWCHTTVQSHPTTAMFSPLEGGLSWSPRRPFLQDQEPSRWPQWTIHTMPSLIPSTSRWLSHEQDRWPTSTTFSSLPWLQFLTRLLALEQALVWQLQPLKLPACTSATTPTLLYSPLEIFSVIAGCKLYTSKLQQTWLFGIAHTAMPPSLVPPTSTTLSGSPALLIQVMPPSWDWLGILTWPPTIPPGDKWAYSFMLSLLWLISPLLLSSIAQQLSTLLPSLSIPQPMPHLPVVSTTCPNVQLQCRSAKIRYPLSVWSTSTPNPSPIDWLESTINKFFICSSSLSTRWL